MQAKALDAIDRNTQAQARRVDDQRDSPRILFGNQQLAMSRLPLAAVVDEAVDDLQPTAQAKGIRLEVAHDASIGGVTLDVARMRQALANLVSNALKFTPEDGIVQVRTRRRGGELHIEVADTGAGLEPAQLPYVFDRFQQADSSPSRRQGGLGLGLSLAQQLVALHGGRIDAHSAGPGHGSTFTVRLPASLRSRAADAAAEAAAEHDPGAELAGKRVLIVEDDDDGREILESILREAHADPRSFARAAGAYDFLAHAPPSEQPDALISDIAMPDEDGYTFIRRVRALEGDEHRHRLAALALTAFARLEDRKRALGAGFDEHVAKPIDSRAVLHTLARVMEAGEEPGADGAARPGGAEDAPRRRASRRPRAR
jgi:CheY-like chemotaxis protein/anti-sigma regulatory factor (Ser/Thr protein kinase)